MAHRPRNFANALWPVAAFAVGIGALLPLRCLAVSHDSPEVKAVVEKGLKHLEDKTDPRLGGECLVALAYLKNGRDGQHKRVHAALEGCRNADPHKQEMDNYTVGCAIIFLCELDSEKHKDLIAKYLDALLRRQKQNGGWGYFTGEHTNTGDTSQTQYAVLGLWMAQRHGFDVPLQTIEKVALWLIRVQDPKGGWGYQGVDPGNFNRVPQGDTTQSLTAAALGSLFILADLIEFGGPVAAQQGKLPSALVVVEQTKTKALRKRRTTIDGALYRKALEDGNAWFDKNFLIPTPSWNFYFMYGYERYRAYRELHEGKFEEQPSWYKTGYDHLAKSQLADGHWEGSAGGPVDSAFCILFLSRSSRKSISTAVANLGEGVLSGGLGLPTNTADIRENNGRLIETPLAGSVDELLALVEDDDNPELAEMAESSQAIVLDKDVNKRSGQVARLRALVRAESPESRLVAVRSLGGTRELDNVPSLLYALSDPNLRVVLEADKALRFISRKLEGVGLEAGATGEQVKQAQAAWTAWFQAIRPDAELLE